MKSCLCAGILVLGLGLSLSSAADPAKAGGQITEPKQALAGTPRKVLLELRAGSRTMNDAAVKATEQIRKNVEGKTASFKMTVKSVDKFQRKEAPTVDRVRITSTVETLTDSGTTFTVFLMAVPDVSEDAKVAKISYGNRITVTGKITNGEIIARDTAELHIDVMDATVK